MKALPTVRAAALLAEPEKRRSLANRGERRTAQRGGHPSHWWVSVTRHRREQTSLAIRCAIRIRKYGANNTAHEPCVYVGHADLLQHTTRGCIDFLGKADYVVDPCGIEHPIEKSGCTFTCVPLTPKVAPNYEAKLQLTGWRPDCEASAPYEGAIVQTDLPLGVPTRSMLGYEICEPFYYDLARPWPPVSGEVAHDLRVTVQFDQKIEIAVHKR